ncbi:MAG TPA: glucosamine-6-phosphate deaminase, partial [Bacilli bacterium]
MNIIKVRNYEELSDKAAEIVAELVKKKENACLGLATGGTPLGMYTKLIEKYQAGEISFKNVKTYNLDEYCGLDKNHPQSYYTYMHTNFFNHVDISENNVHIPEGNTDNHKEACETYNQLLKNNRIDLQILGIGANGHIGFNEPGTPFSQETFVVKLTEKTRNDNRRFFNSLAEVPEYAITMGIKNIMQADAILLLASGKSKAEAVKKLVKGELTE